LSSNNNNLTNNTANLNNYGIYLYFSSNNNIDNNTANLNNGYGICLDSSPNNNNLTNNTANSNDYGIFLTDVDQNNLSGNTVRYNNWDGVYILATSTNNTINNNMMCDNNQGAGTCYDISDLDTNTGDNNTCNTTNGWKDTGTTGCTYVCGSTPSLVISSPNNNTNNHYNNVTNITMSGHRHCPADYSTYVNMTYNINCNESGFILNATELTGEIFSSTYQPLQVITETCIVNYTLECSNGVTSVYMQPSYNIIIDNINPVWSSYTPAADGSTWFNGDFTLNLSTSDIYLYDLNCSIYTAGEVEKWNNYTLTSGTTYGVQNLIDTSGWGSDALMNITCCSSDYHTYSELGGLTYSLSSEIKMMGLNRKVNETKVKSNAIRWNNKNKTKDWVFGKEFNGKFIEYSDKESTDSTLKYVVKKKKTKPKGEEYKVSITLKKPSGKIGIGVPKQNVRLVSKEMLVFVWGDYTFDFSDMKNDYKVILVEDEDYFILYINSSECKGSVCVIDPSVLGHNTGCITATYGFDVDYPVTNLISPVNGTVSEWNNNTFTCTSTDNFNLSNVTIYIWDSLGAVNYTNIQSIEGTTNTSTWDVNLTSGTYGWNCYVCDHVGNCNWSVQYNLSVNSSSGNCTPNLVNGSWTLNYSDACQMNNTQVDNYYKIEYDNNTCNETVNVTYTKSNSSNCTPTYNCTTLTYDPTPNEVIHFKLNNVSGICPSGKIVNAQLNNSDWDACEFTYIADPSGTIVFCENIPDEIPKWIYYLSAGGAGSLLLYYYRYYRKRK